MNKIFNDKSCQKIHNDIKVQDDHVYYLKNKPNNIQNEKVKQSRA